jgi:hypothetical protein
MAAAFFDIFGIFSQLMRELYPVEKNPKPTPTTTAATSAFHRPSKTLTSSATTFGPTPITGATTALAGAGGPPPTKIKPITCLSSEYLEAKKEKYAFRTVGYTEYQEKKVTDLGKLFNKFLRDLEKQPDKRPGIVLLEPLANELEKLAPFNEIRKGVEIANLITDIHQWVKEIRSVNFKPKIRGRKPLEYMYHGELLHIGTVSDKFVTQIRILAAIFPSSSKEIEEIVPDPETIGTPSAEAGIHLGY